MATKIISETKHFSDRIENEMFFLNPSYQRTIQWTKKTYNDFIYNIICALENINTHQIYIGNFEFGTSCFKGNPCLILIDGLQRTTMLSITAFTLYRKLIELNVNGKIDELCQKEYNISDLAWTKTLLDNRWAKKIVYQNPYSCDNIILDQFYNDSDIDIINRGNSDLMDVIRFAKQYIDTLCEKNTPNFILDFYLTLLDIDRCKHVLVFSKTVHSSCDDPSYDYYDEYCRVNNIKQEHDEIQKIKMVIVTMAKQFNKNDASIKFDEVRNRYFRNKDSMLKAYVFACFFRNLLPYKSSSFTKTFRPEFIQETIISLQTNKHTEEAEKIFENFYNDLCGSFIERFYNIINLKDTLKKINFFNNNKDMVYINAFDCTNLSKYRSEKVKKNESLSKMYYALISIDKIMTDTNFGTQEFDGILFKKIIKQYIAFIQLKASSESTVVQTNSDLIGKLYRDGAISFLNDHRYALTKDESTFLFKELSERQDKGGKGLTYFLLALDYTYNNDNWSENLNYIFSNPNLFQIDHILPKSIFKSLEKIKPITDNGTHPEEYAKKCDTLANKRLLGSDENMLHDINEHKKALSQDETEDFKVLTIDELDCALKEKIDHILHHPYFDVLRY